MTLLVALLLTADCAADADCLVTTWRCCACPEQRALSKAQLKAEEDKCATKRCSAKECPDPANPFDTSAAAVCKAGQCVLTAPPKSPPAKAECAAAADCEVWCCQEDLAAAPKGKKPRKGCKRCPRPQPAAECLEGRCQVAPHVLEK